MMKDDVDVNLKNNLLEIIHSVQEKIKASDSKLTKDEIALFFKDITDRKSTRLNSSHAQLVM